MAETHVSNLSQDFDNHTKFVPAFHFVAFPLLFFPTLFFLYRAVTAFSIDNLMMALFAVAALIVMFLARLFPLGVQDRVIKLEETLRMQELFPDDLKARIGELSTAQFVGLRFASDEELADLTRKVLDGGLDDRKSVKQAVKNWRADNVRI
jgi:cell division protein FtsL